MNKFLVRVIDPILQWLAKDKKNSIIALIGVLAGLYFIPYLTLIVLLLFGFGVWKIMH